jgi:hypothetical protein
MHTTNSRRQCKPHPAYADGEMLLNTKNRMGGAPISSSVLHDFLRLTVSRIGLKAKAVFYG